MFSKKSDSEPDRTPAAPVTEPDELVARRTLLRLAAYTAPAVLGTLLITNDAQAQAVSCGPRSCMPNVGPCMPSMCNPATCRPRP